MGKRVNCPACGMSLLIPAPETTYALESEAQPIPKSPQPEEPKTNPQALVPATESITYSAERYKDILAEKPARPMRDHAYWILLLALTPLGFSLLSKEEDSTMARLLRTIEQCPEEFQQRLERLLEAAELGEAGRDDLITALPGGKIEGAHLPRKTSMHFLYAFLSASTFFLLGIYLAPASGSRPLYLLLIGLFTGTAGIVLLLLAQFLAGWAQGRIILSRNIFILVFFWIAWAIGFSYRAALDQDTNFVISFLGYTFGVGLCEEVCKALPLIAYYRNSKRPQWRVAWAWGFASGVGFGVAEGVMYSADHYNGLAPAGIYIVRFVSCVALHAVWSAAVALFIHKHQELIQGDMVWHDFIPRVIFVVAVPMVLHGLYDTALKKEDDVLELLTALASFAWLAWCLQRTRVAEERLVKRKRPRLA